MVLFVKLHPHIHVSANFKFLKLNFQNFIHPSIRHPLIYLPSLMILYVPWTERSTTVDPALEWNVSPSSPPSNTMSSWGHRFLNSCTSIKQEMTGIVLGERERESYQYTCMYGTFAIYIYMYYWIGYWYLHHLKICKGYRCIMTIFFFYFNILFNVLLW